MTESFVRKLVCDECGLDRIETSRSGYALELRAIRTDDGSQNPSGQHPLDGDVLHFCNKTCLAIWLRGQSHF